jgi:hypothetical protein
VSELGFAGSQGHALVPRDGVPAMAAGAAVTVTAADSDYLADLHGGHMPPGSGEDGRPAPAASPQAARQAGLVRKEEHVITRPCWRA